VTVGDKTREEMWTREEREKSEIGERAVLMMERGCYRELRGIGPI
jgi:hypothetical protein